MNKFLGTSLLALALAACSGQPETKADQTTNEVAKTPEPSASVIIGNPNKNAYFGDLHIHTKNSFDAYIFNVRSTPDDVYRFAKGEGVRHPFGYEIKLGGDPLDFVATTDHGAYMGILPAMDTEGHPLSKVEMAKTMFGTDPEAITAAFGLIGNSVRSGIPYDEIYDRDIIDSAWKQSIDAAERHYEPGKLTTFSAYEFTSVKTRAGDDNFVGGNLHRNVVFRNKAPTRLFSTLDSHNPEDLWDWMDAERKDGREVMAIPHNSNVSDGEMFALKSYDGNAFDKAYADQRILNEPIVEMTQVKGTSETHPSLSPNDEWANFEIYEELLSSYTKSKTITGDYVRQALANGLKIEQEVGTNPYKFGMIGASDTHVAGGAFDEQDYWSKVGILDGTPEGRGSVPPGGAKSWEGVERDQNAEHWFSRWGASGLAGVWAEKNTRESIFDAMRRKETYATSGPRIKVRMFGGYDYNAELVDDAEMVAKAYAGGVPMGGDLAKSDTAPGFLVWAMRDPRNAPLQRVQMVKSWYADGQTQEALYDIACSDGASPDPATHRCPDNGASVDLTDCSISTDSGDPELRTLWTDPDFASDISVAYYVRVLENPTCRWSTWDALKAGVERHPDLPPTLQERAYTSPIWYNAGN
jgi:hypothetical protein